MHEQYISVALELIYHMLSCGSVVIELLQQLYISIKLMLVGIIIVGILFDLEIGGS